MIAVLRAIAHAALDLGALCPPDEDRGAEAMLDRALE